MACSLLTNCFRLQTGFFGCKGTTIFPHVQILWKNNRKKLHMLFFCTGMGLHIDAFDLFEGGVSIDGRSA
jgi:hypothetical protein